VVLNHFAEGSQIQTCTILLESHTKKFYQKSIDTFCFIVLTKSVTQNIRGVTERLVRAAQRMLRSCMRFLEQCLRTIQQATPRLPATISQPKRLLNQRNIKGLQIHRCSLVS